MPVYISELAYKSGDSTDFVEIVAPAGTDLSGYSIYVYAPDGTVEQGPVSLGSVTSTIAGKDVYTVDDTTAGFTGMQSTTAVALVDDSGNVVQFLSYEETTNGPNPGPNTVTATEGPASGTTSSNAGTSKADESLETSDDGGTYAAQASPNKGTVPCYAPGTMIATPDGPRVVETLRPGDLVLTVDHGPQPIRWVRSGDHPLEEAEADAKPVLVATGALGKGYPTQDLIVSPQHRMFVGGHGQLDGWFKTEAFAPAKSLTSLPGIRHMKGKQSITWIHFACDRHEVVTANGCLSESLLLGPMVVNGLTRKERQELTDIYGSAEAQDAALNGSAARECLKVGDVRRHLAKSKKDNEPRIAKEIRKWDRDLAMEQWEADRLGFTPSKSQKHNLRLVS